MSLEVLRYHNPDHTKGLRYMTGEEVLIEFLYLSAGFADIEEEHRGVRLGLPPELEARKNELKEYIVSSIESAKKR